MGYILGFLFYFKHSFIVSIIFGSYGATAVEGFPVENESHVGRGRSLPCHCCPSSQETNSGMERSCYIHSSLVASDLEPYQVIRNRSHAAVLRMLKVLSEGTFGILPYASLLRNMPGYY